MPHREMFYKVFSLTAAMAVFVLTLGVTGCTDPEYASFKPRPTPGLGIDDNSDGDPCGDGVCAPGEQCARDCSDGPVVNNSSNNSVDACGDGICADAERNVCRVDCPNGFCGDGVCDEFESARGCPMDCGTVCGDGFCEGRENPDSCPEDCEEGLVCGDGVCGRGEGSQNCPEDCGPPPDRCGDGVCQFDENPQSCFEDCGASNDCGDGVCEFNETPWECNIDCEYIECTPFVPPADNGCPNPGFQTCIALDEGQMLGACVQSGDVPVGERCEAPQDILWGQCTGEALCLTTFGLDECTRLCPQYNDDPTLACADGQVCGLLGDGVNGYCINAPQPTPEPLDPCSNPNDWCADESLCIEVDQRGTAICVKICRLDRGNNDCIDETQCADGFFEGNTFGLCIPSE